MQERQEHDQDIEMLLSAAGTRATPADDVRERTYQNVLQAWQALPAREERPKAHDAPVWRPRLALAASLLAAVAITLLAVPEFTTDPQPVAEIIYAGAPYRVNGETAPGSTQIQPQQEIATDTGQLTLALRGGALITAARDTRLQLAASGEVLLRNGRIYVDADDHAQSLTVITPTSTVKDIGTQFDVQVYGKRGERLVTAVRRGSIAIDNGKQSHVVRVRDDMGQLVRLHEGELIATEPLAPTNTYWDWRREGRIPLKLAGTSVYDYLQWMARDSGRRLKFSRRVAEQTAKLQRFGASDSRTADSESVAEALETTTLQLLDPDAVVWIVDLRG